MCQFIVVVGGCNGSGDRRHKLSLGDRLLQDRKRLGFGGIVAQFCGVIGRDQDTRCDNVDFFQLPKCFKPSQALHMHVEQREVDVFTGRSFESFFARLGLD